MAPTSHRITRDILQPRVKLKLCRFMPVLMALKCAYTSILGTLGSIGYLGLELSLAFVERKKGILKQGYRMVLEK